MGEQIAHYRSIVTDLIDQRLGVVILEVVARDIEPAIICICPDADAAIAAHPVAPDTGAVDIPELAAASTTAARVVLFPVIGIVLGDLIVVQRQGNRTWDRICAETVLLILQ